MTEKKKLSTPLLDELETGPWPSFVKEMKKEVHTPDHQGRGGQLERSYEEHISALEARRPGGGHGLRREA